MDSHRDAFPLLSITCHWHKNVRKLYGALTRADVPEFSVIWCSKFSDGEPSTATKGGPMVPVIKLNIAALKTNALKHLRKHAKALYGEKLEWNQVFGTVTFQVSAEDEAMYSLSLEPEL